MSDIASHDELHWIQVKIRELMWKRGPMKRRALQQAIGSRMWTGADFRDALEGLIAQGVIAQDGSLLRSTDSKRPPDYAEARRADRQGARKRLRKTAIRVSHSDIRRAAVWDKTHGRCWYCGVEMNPFRDFNIDHVVPVSQGGLDDIANLVPACVSCNFTKRHHDVEILRKMYPENHRFYFEGMRVDD